jgi:S-formylglutathione hydrolase FrmB
MTKRRIVLLAAAILLSTAPARAAGSVREIVVPAPSLAGNLLGIPAEQRVAVYLPPSYEEAAERRYPVLYLLHGIADSSAVWTETWNVPAMADELMGEGAGEFLIVMPNAGTRFLGSYYANSPVVGRWEDFIAEDLVGYVDASFRTLARREHRGVTGHSMGGFGAIRLGMHRSDVFGSAYAMSPCCLDMAEDIGWGNPAWLEALRLGSPEDADAALQRGAFYPVAIIALAQVVSPNPSRPLWVDLPIRAEGPELLPVEPTYTAWQEFFPVAEVHRHRESLRSLAALRIDYGLDDQFAHIPIATRRFTERLAELRIPHQVEVYAGDHRELVPGRLRTIVLPFFARILAGPR